MNRRHPRNLLLVLAVVAAAVAAAPVHAADPGGLRQQPLEPAPGSQGRVPAPTGIGGKRGTTPPSLPEDARAPASTTINFKGTRYVVSAGQWYVKRGGDLVAVAPPAGVLVPELPEGHSVRWIGGVPYFYAAGLYYVWRERSRRYEIMQHPPAAEPAAAHPAAPRP